MNLLLEIGLEEIPAAYLAGGLRELESRARTALGEARIWDGGILRLFGAPRRLAFLAEGIKPRQDGLTVLVKGPSCRVGVNGWGAVDEGDCDGLRLGNLPTTLRPGKAAEGFARGQGVAPEELLIRQTAAGFYLFVGKNEVGRETAQVLPTLLAELIGSLEFPRSMRWGDGDVRFIRPIRWLVAVLDGEVVAIEAAGIVAGSDSRGHRTLRPGPVAIARAEDYPAVLRRAFVVADRTERREMVRREVEEAAAAAGGQVRLLPDLLEEVTDLVEFPTAFAGSFPGEYLDLPEEVLVTTMREHQRYFPVEREGKLLPLFVAVRNGGDRGMETVRAGNEKVLRARLADADFFYREDRKKPLAERVEDLKGVLFQESLGSMFDKTERLVGLSVNVGAALGYAGEVERIALLAKTDLLTNVVREFPELQGLMGRKYAWLEGEPPGVAEGIFQHLLPRHPEDVLPDGQGMVVALADKLDTVAGGFLAGLVASGSEDPYGLRRQGGGLVRILAEKDLALSLNDLSREALDGYLREPGASFPVGQAEAEARLKEFLQGRVRGYLIDSGYCNEIVEAVLGVGFDRPADARRRAAALQAMVDGGGLAAVLLPWRRAASLAGEGPSAVDASLLGTEAERTLLAAVQQGEEVARELLPKAAYAEYCGHLGKLGPILDHFFREVMVMVEEEKVRENRLALLRRVAALFAPVARWSALFPLVEAS